MSDVVGSGWTQVTFLRTTGVGSPGRASLTPLSGGGSGPSRVLFFLILSPLGVFSEQGSGVWQSLPWAWRLRAIVGANSEPLPGWAAGFFRSGLFLDPPSLSPLAKALVTLTGHEAGSPGSWSGPGTEEECPGSSRSRV